MSEETIIELTPKQVGIAFRQIHLEENYNFLEDDLVKLANGFARAAAQDIIKAERAECVKFVKSLNLLVGEVLEAKRNAL
jgi:hypothetical protein